MPAEKSVRLDDVQRVLPVSGEASQQTRQIRSPFVSCGRLTGRRRTLSCWANVAFSAMRSVRLRVKSVRELAASETLVGLIHCLNGCISRLLNQFQRIMMWKNMTASCCRSAWHANPNGLVTHP